MIELLWIRTGTPIYNTSIYVFDLCSIYFIVYCQYLFGGGEYGEIVIVRLLFRFRIFMFVEFCVCADLM